MDYNPSALVKQYLYYPAMHTYEAKVYHKQSESVPQNLETTIINRIKQKKKMQEKKSQTCTASNNPT